MNFGIPTQRKKKREEKYPQTPVLTVCVEGKKGTARTMTLNPKACELLGLNDKKAKVAFSFDDGAFILNADQKGIPDKFAIKVTKVLPRRISEKKTYDYFSKKLQLDNSIENEFLLTSSPALTANGEPVAYEIEPLTLTTQNSDEEITSNDKAPNDKGEDLNLDEAKMPESVDKPFDFENEAAKQLIN